MPSVGWHYPFILPWWCWLPESLPPETASLAPLYPGGSKGPTNLTPTCGPGFIPPPDTGGDNHCSSFWLSLKPCFFFCYSGPCKRREMVPAPTFISQTPSRDGHWIN